MKWFPISRLKWVKLYSTQHILPEKNDKMTWGALNRGKWAKKFFFLKMGKNTENKWKQKEKNQKVTHFLLEMRKNIFYPTHPVKKKMKKYYWITPGGA